MVCEWIGIDYYHDFDADLPASIRIAQEIIELSGDIEKDYDSKPLRPISENVLSYYMPYVNDLFSRTILIMARRLNLRLDMMNRQTG